jgi:hypothetical protein
VNEKGGFVVEGIVSLYKQLDVANRYSLPRVRS